MRFNSHIHFSLIRNGAIVQTNPERYRDDNNTAIINAVKNGGISQAYLAIDFNCASCNACKPIRIAMDNTTLSRRSHKRITKKNADLIFAVTAPDNTDDYFNLYLRYLNARHPNSNMLDEKQSQIRDRFNFESLIHKEMATLKNQQGEVVAVTLLFSDSQCLIADYCFFDPELSKSRSLGTYMDLRLIQHAKDTGRSHIYLGAVNRFSRSLSYKTQYLGAEIHENGHWVPIRQIYPDIPTPKQ